MSEQLEQPPRFDSGQAYLAWALAQDRRTELWDGQVVLMAAERVRHNRVKGGVYAALQAAIRDAALPCEVFTDGISVEVGPRTVYEPDALVQCGPRLAGDALVAPSPIIIVEVTSPSNDRREMTAKFRDYFSLPSVQHYLVFYHDKPLLLHHRMDTDGTVHTAFITGGQLVLDPPGIALDVEPLLLPE
jgi:Uma2 family endonuclease